MAKKKYSDDDGRVIASMNVEGMPGYMSEKQRRVQRELQRMKLTRKERRAIARAAYVSLIPMFICIAVSFTLAMLFVAFVWLR